MNQNHLPHIHMPAMGLEKWLITFAVMIVTIAEVLDMTIVSVSLPHMMGSLGANATEITWVLTSYIVSSAVCMLLTGFLVTRYGRKRLLLINIFGFLVASMLCGMSTNLTQIVFFRILQGICGASLVPISQFVLRDTFPLKEQGQAMAIWGIGMMVAPTFGPTLGGYITDTLNWRWVFYINVPVCLTGFLICLTVIKESPTKKVAIDWLGLALMFVGVGALQYLLDQGSEKNWFDSKLIQTLTLISGLCIPFFVYQCFHSKEPIINFRVFRDRNFCLSTLMLTVFGTGIFGTLNLQPILLEKIMLYSAQTTGVVMIPRGIASAISMMMVGILLNRLDPRVFILLGVSLSGLGTFMLYHLNLSTDMTTALFIPNILQGAGMGLFFVPLSALSMCTLEKQDIPLASGVFSFGRNLGMSIGISILMTIVTQTTQQTFHQLGGPLNPFNPNFQNYLQAKHLTLLTLQNSPDLFFEIQRQSNFIGFNNAFWFASISFIIMIPCVFLLKRPDFKHQEITLGH